MLFHIHTHALQTRLVALCCSRSATKNRKHFVSGHNQPTILTHEHHSDQISRFTPKETPRLIITYLPIWVLSLVSTSTSACIDACTTSVAGMLRQLRSLGVHEIVVKIGHLNRQLGMKFNNHLQRLQVVLNVFSQLFSRLPHRDQFPDITNFSWHLVYFSTRKNKDPWNFAVQFMICNMA